MGMFDQVLMYNPPSNMSAKDAAQLYQKCVMTMGNGREEYLREMISHGYKGKAWLYWLQNAVHTVASPNHNNVGFKPGDYAKMPDEIFIKTPDGKKRVMKNEKQDYAVVDVRLPYWFSFFMARTQEVIARNPDLWIGGWLDDLNPRFHVNGVGMVRTLQFGDTERNTQDAAKYRATLANYLKRLRDAFHANRWRFGGNLQGAELDEWLEVERELTHGGGVVMNEHQFLNHKGEYQPVAQWELDLNKTSEGEVWNVSQQDAAKIAAGDPEELEKLDFFLASHALRAKENDAIHVGRDYGKAYKIPRIEEVKKLGKATGEMYVTNGIYTRHFEGGLVSVNPATHKAAFTFIPPDPPKPERVTLNVNLQFTVDAAQAAVIQKALDSLDITVTTAPVVPTIA